MILARSRQRPKSQRAFTLTELLVAVTILIVVIVATAKIFGTVGRVAGLGEAGSAVMQEAAAIERQIRNDFEKLSREGFFMIRCVAVPNNVNLAAGGPLLNPALAPGAYVRADQLIFFTHGVQSIQTLRSDAGMIHKGQGAVSRVYYGHAFQVTAGPPAVVANLPSYVEAVDPRVIAGKPIVPWSRGTRDFDKTVFQSDAAGAPADYSTTSYGSPLVITQPPATRWLLARQAVVLASDGPGANPNIFLATPAPGPGTAVIGNRSTQSILDPVIINGRVDAAAEQLDDMRRGLLGDSNSDGLPDLNWTAQREMVSSALFYPRAERVAPGMHRVDQALTNNVFANACSSFIIDWTWADGVGGVTDSAGVAHRGAFLRRSHEQLWFGLDPEVARYVQSFTWLASLNDPGTIDPEVIEPLPPTQATRDIQNDPAILVYEAIFGFNQNVPLNPATGLPWNPTNGAAAYTPWPTSIRITMTIHDPGGRLETGREVEFVINLPNSNG